MSFEMESEKHAINMTYEPIHGLTIIGLTCPHEKTIEAIEVILNLHYMEGDMNPKEVIDKICHLVLPESSPSCSEEATEK